MNKRMDNHEGNTLTTEFFRRDDRHLEGLYSMCWRGPFVGFSAARNPEVPEPSISFSEMRWRGPFEGTR